MKKTVYLRLVASTLFFALLISFFGSLHKAYALYSISITTAPIHFTSPLDVVPVIITATTTDPTGIYWTIDGSPISNAQIISSSSITYTVPADANFTSTPHEVKASANSDRTSFSTIAAWVDPYTVSITPSTTPSFSSVLSTSQVHFTASTSDPSGVTWSVIGGLGDGNLASGFTNDLGSINSSTGVYTPPTHSNIVRIQVVTNDSSAAGSAETYVSVGSIPISVTPQLVLLTQNATSSFSASTTDPSGVNWTVTGGAGNGTISSSGLYTAPATDGVYDIVATSKADSNSVSKARVCVVNTATSTCNMVLINSQIDPFTLSANPITLTATTTDPAGFTWSVQNSDPFHLYGSVDSSGVYTPKVNPVVGVLDFNSVYLKNFSNPITLRATGNSAGEHDDNNVFVYRPPSNNAISVSISPSSASIYQNQTQAFTATVTGTSDNRVSWSLPYCGSFGCAHGSVDQNGNYTPPTSRGTDLLVATSYADPSKIALVNIEILNGNAPVNNNPPSPTTGVSLNAIGGGTGYPVSISPASTTVEVGSSVFFTGKIDSSAAQNLTWVVKEGLAGGWFDDNIKNKYIAPQTPGIYHIILTSLYGTNATATVNVIPKTIDLPSNISVSIQPKTANLIFGDTQQFTSTVLNAPTTIASSTAVLWTIENVSSTTTASSTINQNGLYVAPNVVGKYLVKATSLIDQTKFDTATVFVSAPPVVPNKEIATTTIKKVENADEAVASSSGSTVAQISQNTPSPVAVSWGIVEPHGGSITPTGLYTAPTVLGTYHITVASLVDASKTAVATINVVSNPVISSSLVLPNFSKNNSNYLLMSLASFFTNKVFASETATATDAVGVSSVVVVPATVDLYPGQTQQFVATVVLANNSTVSNILKNSEQAISNIGDFVSKAADVTSKAANTPEGTIVVHTVTTVGAVTGASAMSITSLFANPLLAGPLTTSEVFLVPFRLWGLFLSALGLKKRRKPWGTVYNSVTKMPIDPAFVTLYDSGRKQVSTSITDMEGRFGFIVPKGTYTISVKKSNFAFPSTKLSGKLSDDLYQDLYFGDKIEVLEDGQVITKNIPLDPLNFDWNEFAKSKKSFNQEERLFARVSNGVFWTGFVISFLSVLIIPHLYSISILSLYVVLIALRLLGLRPKTFGTVVDKVTGNPLSFASISVYSESLKRELFKKVADQYGRYYFLVPKGEYEIKIARKNIDESYTQVYDNVVAVKNGVVNGEIRV